MSGSVNRFLGGSPLGVVFKLVIVSLLVGIVLSALGLTPMALVQGVIDFFHRLWTLGFDALGQFGDWLILGATLVIPVWLLMRVLEAGKR